jgi:hypothetical protein
VGNIEPKCVWASSSKKMDQVKGRQGKKKKKKKKQAMLMKHFKP